jgi:glutamate synthase (NADPH/NADH) small chain
VGSAKTILDSNIFGGSCARVCPTEVLCEGACVDNTLLKEPVRIGALQRYACDTAHDESMGFYAPGPSTGKRVAVVGAGPAGLTCAHELRKRGHEVVVFEARKLAGGLNTFGIAAYKQDTKIALSEVDRIMNMKIDLRLGKKIDASKLAGLLEEFDAVFLGIGLGRTAPLHIPGEDLQGVWESLDFIAQTHTRPYHKCTVGETVIVIGGGNTAIDAARAALRLGAGSVTIAYRRDEASMPAFAHEVDDAVAEGVGIIWNAMPLKMVGKSGRVTGVRFAHTRLDGKGRKAKLKAVRGSEFTIDADMVIKALGQEPLLDLLEAIPGLKLAPNGRIVVDSVTLATSVPKLFAGGDAASGAKEEVVNAVQSGKVAAQAIHQVLS